MKIEALICSLLIGSALLLASCGTGTDTQSCSAIGITVGPSNATADHAAAAPGDRVQFFANAVVPSGCATAAVALNGTTGLRWSVSDTDHVAISNTPATVDGTNGTATCIGSAPNPVTVTATFTEPTTKANLTATASLVCK